MTTTIIHSDIAGTSFTGAEFDYRKLKATRKFIVYSTRTELGNETNGLIADLRAEDASDGANVVKTLLGPLLTITDSDGDPEPNTGQPIVHPDSNELPLGTVDVARLGDRKFLVTANYFVQPGVVGGSSNTPNTMSLRTELVAIRKYKQGSTSWLPTNVPSSQTPIKYSYVVTVPQIRVKIPFYEYSNPMQDLSLFNYLGGLNSTSNMELGGITWGRDQLRFDGVSMDEFGTVVTQNSQTYKFRGFYEFTARGGGWDEDVPTLNQGTNLWQITSQRPSIVEGAQWTLANLGLS